MDLVFAMPSGLEKLENKTLVNWDTNVEVQLNYLGVPRVNEVQLVINETYV